MITIGKEGQPNTPDQKTSLLPEEVDANAFRFINEFRACLRKSESFRTAAAWVYFGQLDYGFVIEPENARKIVIAKGNTSWSIVFTFTERTQRLTIDRYTSQSPTELRDEYIELASKRFSHQGRNPQASVTYYDLSSNTASIREVNNPAALSKVEEILTGLKASF